MPWAQRSPQPRRFVSLENIGPYSDFTSVRLAPAKRNYRAFQRDGPGFEAVCCWIGSVFLKHPVFQIVGSDWIETWRKIMPVKPRQGKWRKLLWKINGRNMLFFEKRIDEMTWLWIIFSTANYTCLGQRPRNPCPFVSKIFSVILLPHQLGIVHGFPRISFDLDSPHHSAAHLHATKKISLLDQMTFLWCWPWNLSLCVSESFLLH